MAPFVDGVEVKSGRAGKHVRLRAFTKRFEAARGFVLRTGGLRLDEMLGSALQSWLALR